MFNTKDRSRTQNRNGQHQRQHPAGGLPSPKKQSQNSRTPQSPSAFTPTKWGPRTSATLPNPVNQTPAKVRVQAGAGDKCVPPGKSKQKRRQAVPGRPIDQSTLSMDAVIWSDETYTVEQLVHAYGGKLPVIAKVIEGYQDNTGDSLSVNQVVQCHSFSKQKRIRAGTGSSGGMLSIPADYPMHVFTKDNNKEDRVQLEELLERRSLPVNVRVTSVDEDIEVSTVNVIGKDLLITETYDELFIRTNTINDGWVDQEEIHAIPTCFPAVFSIAVGMRGASEDEWTDYYGMFTRSVRHLKFMVLNGYEGIIIEDDAGGTIKLEEPKPVSKRGSQGPVYENITRSQSEKQRSYTMDPRPSTSRQGHSYENWDKSNFQKPMMRSKSEKQPPTEKRTTMDFQSQEIIINPIELNSTSHDNRQVASPLSKSPPGRDTGFDPPASLPDVVTGQVSRLAVSSPTSPTSPGRPHTPASEGEYDVQEMFNSVLDVAEEQETLKRQKEMDQRKIEQQEMLFLKRREEEERRREQIRANLQQRELARVNSVNQSPQPAPPSSPFKIIQMQNSRNQEITGQSNNQNVIENNRPSYRSSGSSQELNPAELSDIHVEVHRDPSPRASTDISTRDKGVKTLAKQFQNAPRSPTGLSPELYQPQGRGNPARGVVQPTVPPPHIVTINVTNTENVQNGQNVQNGHIYSTHVDMNCNGPLSPGTNINTIDDVPSDVIELTVEDVCKCLELLNMDKHVADFRKRRVDGKSLIAVKEPSLINDFKFTPFNASKLMRFVRGWRPKSTG